jgi:hypothetical protein
MLNAKVQKLEVRGSRGRFFGRGWSRFASQKFRTSPEIQVHVKPTPNHIVRAALNELPTTCMQGIYSGFINYLSSPTQDMTY